MSILENNRTHNRRKANQYQAIRTGLELAFNRPDNQMVLNLDINSAKIVIFSDHHKGVRDGADDFNDSEPAYHAALAYYYAKDYTLVVLGDAEELWENRPKSVLRQYEYTFRLEAKFHDKGQYYRIWGNHDLEWSNKGQFNKHLAPYNIFQSPPVHVWESLKINLTKDDTSIGTVFLVHGHQGSFWSDKLAYLAKIGVRWFWRPYQLITKKRIDTPARNWELRENHNIAMRDWVDTHERLILIAGHTHHPVFESYTHAAEIQQALDDARQAQPYDLEKIARRSAKLEWVRARKGNSIGPEGEIEARDPSKPCYFNSGCCCFSDGNITGLEIAEGHIRLVRWAGAQNTLEIEPDILDSVSLEDILNSRERRRPRYNEPSGIDKILGEP